MCPQIPSLLAPDCTWEQIQELCDDALRYGTASVCIPPCYVKQAKDKPISYEQYQKLTAQLGKRSKDAILPVQIAYFTGLRLGDAYGKIRLKLEQIQ